MSDPEQRRERRIGIGALEPRPLPLIDPGSFSRRLLAQPAPLAKRSNAGREGGPRLSDWLIEKVHGHMTLYIDRGGRSAKP